MKNLQLAIQRFLITNKIVITRVFQAAELALVVFLVVGTYLMLTRLEYQFPLYEMSRNFGIAALILYLVTLIPGILTRLRFQPLIGAMIQPFRRHFGISMFLCAIVHSMFGVFVLSFEAGVVPQFNMHKLMGLTAVLLLFPLWLTSNDVSQKYLGKNWKLLHRLTYIALFFIFLHVAIARSDWMYPALAGLILEVVSWLFFWFRKRATTSPAMQ